MNTKIELPCTTGDKIYFWNKGYVDEVIIRWWKASYINNIFEVEFFADSVRNHLKFGLKDIENKRVFFTYQDALEVRQYETD